MTTRKPAECFPPRDFIQEEMEERGWSAYTLAEVMDMTHADAQLLVGGEMAITTDIANRLQRAFGVSAKYWLALEAYYVEFLDRLEAELDAAPATPQED